MTIFDGRSWPDPEAENVLSRTINSGETGRSAEDESPRGGRPPCAADVFLVSRIGPFGIRFFQTGNDSQEFPQPRGEQGHQLPVNTSRSA